MKNKIKDKYLKKKDKEKIKQHDLESNDVVKFYELYNHFDIISRNIGIIGDNNKYQKYLSSIITSLQGKPIRIINNELNTKCTILIDDIEYTYIHIQDYKDMYGKKFRKFV